MPEQGKLYALLMGINQYENPSVRNITLEDIQKVLAATRPSVSPQDLAHYENWAQR